MTTPHTELDEILYQNLQFTELGNFPEAVPTGKNWVSVMGKVYAFDFTEAKAALTAYISREIAEVIEAGVEYIDHRKDVTDRLKGWNDGISCSVREQKATAKAKGYDV